MADKSLVLQTVAIEYCAPAIDELQRKLKAAQEEIERLKRELKRARDELDESHEEMEDDPAQLFYDHVFPGALD